MKVTKIEIQQKNKKRVSVFCDDEYAFSLSAETAIKHSIKVGSEITQAQINNLTYESDALTAINKASEYVTKGLKTKKQIADHLKNKGFEPSIIENAIKVLSEYKLVNDEQYIKAFIADHQSYGELKLKQELLLKGIDKELLDNYFNNTYEVNLEKLEALKNKFFKGKEQSLENIIKCKKHLLSKGFKYEDINMLNWSEHESWD